MLDRDSVLQAVPIGRENAVGLTKIQDALGLFSSKAVRRHLVELVASEEVLPVSFHARPLLKMTVYYRSRV
jgi:hypothetical protein